MSKYENALQILLINLDSSKERLLAAKAQLDDAGLTFTRIAAVDGRGLKPSHFPEYRAKPTLRLIGRELLGSEVACYLSHVRALETFLAGSQPYALVLEDDFELTPTSMEAINLLVERGHELRGFDLCNLGSGAGSPRRRTGMSVGGASLQRTFVPPVRTHAVVWTRAGAARFLAERSAPCGPIDEVICDWGVGTGRVLAFSPRVILSSDARSEITGEDEGLRRRLAETNTGMMEARFGRSARYWLINTFALLWYDLRKVGLRR